jgi:hypothetical protein
MKRQRGMKRQRERERERERRERERERLRKREESVGLEDPGFTPGLPEKLYMSVKFCS